MSTILKGDFVYRAEPPIVVQRASGARLFSRGREYIDCQASSGAAVLGYDVSLLSQLDFANGPVSKPQTCESERRLLLAARLEHLIWACTGRHGHVGFELGGAQAIELALKIALSSSRSISIFTFEGAYHGRSLFTSHLSSSRRYTLGTPFALTLHRLPNPHFVAERDAVDLGAATERCIRHVERLFFDERYGVTDPNGSRPVLLYETVQNVSGMLDMPSTYLQRVEELVRDVDGISIADEIFTGMYRFGSFFSHPDKGLKPDVVAFSKGLTNGLVPLSAIWVSNDSALAETFSPGTHSCTYLNNELALSVAHAVLDRLALLDTQAIAQLGRSLKGAIQRRFGVDLPAATFDKGAVLRLDFPDGHVTKAVAAKLLDGFKVGILFASTGLAVRSIIFHPPYTINATDLDEAGETIGAALEMCCAQESRILLQ
jgi:4-aminobutyrate aminotransferase-like enzyme